MTKHFDVSILFRMLYQIENHRGENWHNSYNTLGEERKSWRRIDKKVESKR